MALSSHNNLIDAYRCLPGVPDEMLDTAGNVRPDWRYVGQTLNALSQGELVTRQQEARRLLQDSGVTYTLHGTPQGLEHPWQLDPIPYLVASDAWAAIESGLMQRAELMNLLLKDIYGPQELIKKGILPLELIYAHGGFLRPCHAIPFPGEHALAFYAADLARGTDGRMWVLGDRSQAPSGAGYALENRVVMTRILPSLFRDAHVHRLALFFQNLRASIARGVKILMRPCASPHAPVVGHCGTHIRLDVRHHRSRKHLPIVALRRAAYPKRFGISRHRRHLSASIAFVVLRCPSGAHFEASAL